MEFGGSSPLTRGKPPTSSATRNWRGLIPAHAGKTDPTRGGKAPRRAHPRSRGENRVGGAADEVGQGSSPLTRGKRYRMVRF